LATGLALLLASINPWQAAHGLTPIGWLTTLSARQAVRRLETVASGIGELELLPRPTYTNIFWTVYL
jgi:hypothetical protein